MPAAITDWEDTMNEMTVKTQVDGWRLSVKQSMRVGDVDMTYRLDDFTSPWRKSETILMIHGNAESGLAWFAWVPALAKEFRVLRPDLRGFGESTPMPEDHHWTLDGMVADLVGLLDALSIERVHVIGAKIGGMVAIHLAATHPQRVTSLTVLGAPVTGASLGPEKSLDEIRTKGVEHWARRTMRARLGSSMPQEALDWWTDFMGKTPQSSQIGFIRDLPAFDVVPDLPRVRCPTLIVANATGDVIGSIDTIRTWQPKIPNSEIATLTSSSYHIAAAAADEAAKVTLAFIRRHPGP